MILRTYQKPHAEKLLAILMDKRTALDSSDCGCGKTFSGAWIARELGVETLVVCPLSVVPVWERVLAEAGVTAEVWNYESAWRKLGTVKPYGSGSFFQFTKAWPFVIFDEVHRCAGETTMQSKLLIAAKRQCGRVLGLSATAFSTLLKCKAIGFMLNLHALSDYRLWLFTQGVKEVEMKLRNGRAFKKLTIGKEADRRAMEILHERIFGLAGRGSRMRIADIPDFPKTIIEVRLLAGAPAAVMRLSEEMQAFYRERNVRAAMTKDEMAQLVFWRQASETAKIPMLLDMAEDAIQTSKVCCFVNFNATMDELLAGAKAKGWTTGFIRGDDKKDRQQTIADFQDNKIDFLVANIQAGGAGVSLHDEVTQYPRTSLVCPTWSAVDLRQVFGRPHRDSGGLSRQFMVCWNNGIETRVAKSVERKLSNISTLNDGDLEGAEDLVLA